MNATTVTRDVTSEDPQRLFRFYRDIVGLAPRPDAGPAALDVAGSLLRFHPNSGPSGRWPEPANFLVDLPVVDAREAQRRIASRGVAFVGSGFAPWQRSAPVFLDPDGNYCRLVQLYAPGAA